MRELNLLFAMHDAAPIHLARMERAEALFERWGIRKAMYLFVPNFHGTHPADASASFRSWCLRPRPWDVTWFLHGYYHLRTEETCGGNGRLVAAPTAGPTQRTDESEFRRLPPTELHNRLQRGEEMFEACLGHEPQGFVAPQWLFNKHLSPALRSRGYAWTEGRLAVQHVPSGRSRLTPVITWATRTPWRKRVSLFGAELLSRLWADSPWLRIAVHPFDFDHPQTVASIERVVCQAVERRAQRSYPELQSLFDGASRSSPDHGRQAAA